MNAARHIGRSALLGAGIAAATALMATAPEAQAAPPPEFEDFKTQLQSFETAYVSVAINMNAEALLPTVGLALPDLLRNNGTWVVRGRAGDATIPPSFIADAYMNAERRVYWDGSEVWRSRFMEAPVHLETYDDTVAALFAEMRAGFPTTTVTSEVPWAAGLPRSVMDDKQTWVKLRFVDPALEDIDVYLSLNDNPWVLPRDVLVATGSTLLVKLTVSIFELDVPLDSTIFGRVADRPVTSPLLCGRNPVCEQIPPELEDRIAPSGDLISRLPRSLWSSYGVTADRKAILCHFPPGYPDHKFTIEIDLADARDHMLNHGDHRGACAGQKARDARDYTEDPEGKTTLCHVPPGDPSAAHTLQVANAAVQAHLDHGDYLGSCYPSESTEPSGGDDPTTDGGDGGPDGDAPPDGQEGGEANPPPDTGVLGCTGCASGPGAPAAWLLLPLAALSGRRRAGPIPRGSGARARPASRATRM